MYNLVFAVIWLVAGLALLLTENHVVLMGTNISFGWLCLIMVAFNIYRWRSQAAAAQTSTPLEPEGPKN